MKILLLLFFGVGHIDNVAGTEKVFVNMANAFSQRGYRVIAIYNDSPGKKPFYAVDEKVELINLAMRKIFPPISKKILREVYRIFKFKITNPVEIYKSEMFAKKIEEKIKNSEIYSVVCFEYNSVVVANKLGITPRIAMVHNCIDELIKPLTKKELEQANKMTAYQVLMPSFVKEAQRYLSTEIVYIPNAIDKVTLARQEKQISDRNKHTIICIGRLEAEQKQQHILLQAFALLADKYPQWEVDIYGLGYNLERDAYKEELLHIINKYKMEKQVHLKGVTDKILEKMCQADILAMPSAYEGFSMVLGDAMSIGLPAVGFVNAPSVNELIVNNVTGVLCADTIKDYAAGLEKLMCNERLRRELGNNAYLAAQEYSAEKVWNKWENLFKRLHEQ